MKNTDQPWAVVIFACRESLPRLRQTLDAAIKSAASCSAVHVLINGNSALASALAAELTQRQPHDAINDTRPAIRVWSIPLGDKANAWNQYIHHIWAGEEIAFFVDGYVSVNPDAVELLGHAVTASHQALGGSGVPSMGRSARLMRQDMIDTSGFHGNFCCIKGDAIGAMRDRQIRLPVGMYRCDGLMRAILLYALDPASHDWDAARIRVHSEASWRIDPAQWWRIRDVRAFFNRYRRQARGILENAALRDYLTRRQCSPAGLPATAQELVLEWVKRCPSDYLRLARRHLLIKQTLNSFRDSDLPSKEMVKATVIWKS